MSFDNILMLDNSGKTTIGTPMVQGASVEAKIVKHLKDDKVIVFKKKRRKGYKVKNGHRQSLTQIVIENILEKKISDTKIILNANLLEKKSKLRNLFEKNKELVIVPTYKDTSVGLLEIARKFNPIAINPVNAKAVVI